MFKILVFNSYCLLSDLLTWLEVLLSEPKAPILDFDFRIVL